MKSRNMVFIATSMDGYIADKNGGLDWLQLVPNPNMIDLGYKKFMNRVDALVMGRRTFETVCSFGGDWPYKIPVFVLSNSLNAIPEKLQEKVQLVKGSLAKIIEQINKLGHTQLYIDGGVTIQKFLREDLIDEIIITTIPILLGGGISLFGDLPKEMNFEFIKSEVYLDAIVQTSYKRKR